MKTTGKKERDTCRTRGPVIEKRPLPHLIILVTVLSVVQTLLDQTGVLLSWPAGLRAFFLHVNLTVDMILTAEFFLLLYGAVKKKDLAGLVSSPGFWINFLSSLPLLFLHSGLSVLMLRPEAGLTAPAAWFLKFTVAFQYFRVLKLAWYLRPSGSPLTKSHAGRSLLLGPGVLAILLLLFSFIRMSELKEAAGQRVRHYRQALGSIENIHLTLSVPLRPLIFKSFSGDDLVLRMTLNEFLIFSRRPDEGSGKVFLPPDHLKVQRSEYTLFLSGADLAKSMAWTHLADTLSLLLLVLFILLIQAKQFDRRVSRILALIKRGISEKDYNLMVKAKESRDELGELIRSYHDEILPRKQKQAEEEGLTTPLTGTDLEVLIRKRR
jgi:hypothetical protein